MAPSREAEMLEGLAREISVDQAHAHGTHNLQRVIDNLAYWADQMIQHNDRGEVAPKNVRDGLVIALHEAQAVVDHPLTPESVSWWFGRYLQRSRELEDRASGLTEPKPQRNGRRRKDASWVPEVAREA